MHEQSMTADDLFLCYSIVSLSTSVADGYLLNQYRQRNNYILTDISDIG